MANQADTDVNELLARIAKLEALLAQQSVADTSRADIWYLLDRSGSMDVIAEYVVQGYDEFIAEQRKEKGEATMTLVQFDGEDIHEVVFDARPLAEVKSIAGRFEPRGATPLHDAIALLLDRAEAHLRHSDADPANQLVVIFTDGHERQPALDRPGDLRTHRRPAKGRVDLRVRGRQPGQLRNRFGDWRGRGEHVQLHRLADERAGHPPRADPVRAGVAG